MANISSTDLFHFVREERFLKGIIQHKSFWPYYCVEYCWAKRHWAIPMVCFCDIPLSQIRNHINKYGGNGYGIGMSKKWAVSSGISPVLYASYNSPIYRQLKKFSSTFIPSTSENDMSVSERLLYTMKRVTASEEEQRHIARGKKRKFYNEREWRYIPPISKEVHMEPWIPIKHGNESDYRRKLSEKTKCLRLHFKVDDVKYIITPDEEGCHSMIKFLNSLDNLSLIEKDILKTKIITTTDIKNNF